MVGTSSFRAKYRSKALKQLALERASKKDPVVENNDEDESDDSLDRDRPVKKSRNHDSLLSILPEPTNSKYSPGFDLLSELIAEQKEDHNDDLKDEDKDRGIEVPTDMIEVNVNDLVNKEPIEPHIKNSQRTDPIKMPKSKEKEKNQITHLAKLAKAAEFVIQERASQGRANKAAARSKYGW
jgi:hypothetical protein